MVAAQDEEDIDYPPRKVDLHRPRHLRKQIISQNEAALSCDEVDEDDIDYPKRKVDNRRRA